jgi:hypothetical protein
MRGAFLGLFAGAALLLGGCGDEETTKYCDQACTIWADCEWNYDTCMSQCKADKDWDKAYLECLQNAGSCAALESCG